MNKAELVKIVAEGTGLTMQEVAAVTDGLLETISEELVAGGRVELRGFGVFKVEQRHEREAVNPRTGERMIVPPKKMPVFRPSKLMKADVKHSE